FLREMVTPQGFGKTDLTQTFTQTGAFGLLNGGIFTFPGVPELSLSINDFVNRTFAPLAADPVKGAAVTEFVREFDTGSAPMIGLVWTVDPANPSAADNVFRMIENQAKEANVGGAAYTRSAGVERGFWYDVPNDNWHQEGGSLTLTRAQVLALAVAASDAVI